MNVCSGCTIQALGELKSGVWAVLKELRDNAVDNILEQIFVLAGNLLEILELVRGNHDPLDLLLCALAFHSSHTKLIAIKLQLVDGLHSTDGAR